MELIRLKVNSQYRPCVDEVPYFSWVITSSKKNVMQTSYHITVTGPGEVVSVSYTHLTLPTNSLV